MEEKKDAIMEAHLGINLEAKLEAIFDATLQNRKHDWELD